MIKSNFLKRLFTSLLILPLFIFIIIRGGSLFNLFLIVIFFLSFFEWTKINLNNFLSVVLGMFFLIFSFYSAFLIRENIEYNLFLFLVLVSVSTDIGGYCFGKLLKGPKLTKISPKKTFSGSIGSFLMSLILGVLFVRYFNIQISFNIYLVIFILSLISQIGDLTISFIKRKNKFKDTGNILPGHGGILDRIDGLIFVFPFYYFFFY